MGKKIKFETVALPQNVKLMGEKEEKSIYISLKAYKKVHDFTKNKFDNESGGLLIGEYVEAFNTISIVIHDFIEAKYTEATKTTLTFTHKTWEYVHGEIDNNYENAKIVGWIHTHPGFGIFLSDYDKFIQNNFFSDENQVAYVVDPIQKLEGFFAIINGNLQKCKGFYIFDDVGNDIVLGEEKPKDEKKENIKREDKKIGLKENSSTPILLYLLIVILFALNILMFLASSSRQKKLETKIEQLEDRMDDLIINGVNPLIREFNELRAAHNALLNENNKKPETNAPEAEVVESEIEESEKKVEERVSTRSNVN